MKKCVHPLQLCSLYFLVKLVKSMPDITNSLSSHLSIVQLYVLATLFLADRLTDCIHEMESVLINLDTHNSSVKALSSGQLGAGIQCKNVKIVRNAIIPDQLGACS